MFLFKIFNSNKHQFTLHLDLDEHILDGELANTELKYEEYLQPTSPSLQTAAVPPCLLLLLLRLPLLLSQPTSQPVTPAVQLTHSAHSLLQLQLHSIHQQFSLFLLLLQLQVQLSPILWLCLLTVSQPASPPSSSATCSITATLGACWSWPPDNKDKSIFALYYNTTISPSSTNLLKNSLGRPGLWGKMPMASSNSMRLHMWWCHRMWMWQQLQLNRKIIIIATCVQKSF